MKSRIALVALAVALLATQARPAAAQLGGSPDQPDVTIDARVKAAALDTLCAGLDSTYVYPDMAKQIVRALRQHQAHHDYDRITSAKEFADSLTSHLRAVNHDRHLRVQYRAETFGGRELTSEATPAEIESHIRDMRQRNFGFENVRRLPGNVGYLDLRGFMSIEAGAGDVAVATMNYLANTDALIIDLRRNGGGEPEMVQLLISYLYARGAHVHLNDLYFRPSNETTQYWTQPFSPGPHFEDKPVYVLTSHRTASAGEEFTYNLKNLKRATLVGETTAGAAHPGGFVRLGDHFVAFIATGRAINAVTKDDWEGRGIAPDVVAPVNEALKVAHTAALQKLLDGAKDDAEKARLKRSIDAAAVFPDPYNDPLPPMAGGPGGPGGAAPVRVAH